MDAAVLLLPQIVRGKNDKVPHSLCKTQSSLLYKIFTIDYQKG